MDILYGTNVTINKCRITEGYLCCIGSVVINDCKISKNTIGISVDGGDVTIKNCDIIENIQAGIKSNSSHACVFINNCNIVKNSEYGILVEACKKVTIDNCKIKLNHYGIRTDAYTVVRNTKISNNIWNGVELADEAEAEVRNCTISDNGNNGVFLEAFAKGTFEYNDIKNNVRIGVSLFDSHAVNRVTGKSNNFGGNGNGAVFPEALNFLSSYSGGEYHR